MCLHSCGCVAELFDDLVEIGLNVFNPFQPEVMDVFELKQRYHGRLAFHGGMSIQKVLPFGTPDEVRRATRRLIEAGRPGGYIFCAVPQRPARRAAGEPGGHDGGAARAERIRPSPPSWRRRA